jgi:hypothetical protein
LGGRGLDRSFAVELPVNLADLDSLKRMLPGSGVERRFNLPANLGRLQALPQTYGPIGDGPDRPHGIDVPGIGFRQ